MSTLSPSEIQAYAANAGFSGDDLTTAQAIALAESSGNPAAIGDNGNSVGLFQINLPAHPEYSGIDLTDPQANADAAYNIFEAAGSTFSPWSTYVSGAYQDYLPEDSSSGVTLEAGALAAPSSLWLLFGAVAFGLLLWWAWE
jgi:Lysozyme like domain